MPTEVCVVCLAAHHPGELCLIGPQALSSEQLGFRYEAQMRKVMDLLILRPETGPLREALQAIHTQVILGDFNEEPALWRTAILDAFHGYGPEMDSAEQYFLKLLRTGGKARQELREYFEQQKSPARDVSPKRSPQREEHESSEEEQGVQRFSTEEVEAARQLVQQILELREEVRDTERRKDHLQEEILMRKPGSKRLPKLKQEYTDVEAELLRHNKALRKQMKRFDQLWTDAVYRNSTAVLEREIAELSELGLKESSRPAAYDAEQSVEWGVANMRLTTELREFDAETEDLAMDYPEVLYDPVLGESTYPRDDFRAARDKERLQRAAQFWQQNSRQVLTDFDASTRSKYWAQSTQERKDRVRVQRQRLREAVEEEMMKAIAML